MSESDTASDVSDVSKVPTAALSTPVSCSSHEHLIDVAKPSGTPVSVWLLAGCVVLIVVAFFFVEPAISLFQAKPSFKTSRFQGARLQEIALQRTFEVLTVAWFFMLGASFGSFLHCLEYRMPRGISIVARGSSCPGCGTPIRLWHNVPVFGWLVLRGRCAACGWTIPARYAVTEFVFGLAFALLMVVELVGGGINLPLRPLPEHVGMMWNVWTPKWDLISIYAYHMALVTFLLTWCLFACDHLRVSRSLFGFALLVGALSPIIRSHLHPLNWDDQQHLAEFLGPRGEALVNVLLGVVAGLGLGAVMIRRANGNVRHGDATTALSATMLVGVFLGWQAALGIALLTTCFRWLAVIFAARRWPVVVWITFSTIIYLVAWRWLYQQPYWTIHFGAWGTIIATLAIVAVGSWLLDRYEQGGDAGPPQLNPAFPETPRCESDDNEAENSQDGVTSLRSNNPDVLDTCSHAITHEVPLQQDRDTLR